LPSTSQIFEPDAFATKKGDEPTDPKARTGLLTPPGINLFAFLNRASERFLIRSPHVRLGWNNGVME
jgi:hypothetical protein